MRANVTIMKPPIRVAVKIHLKLLRRKVIDEEVSRICYAGISFLLPRSMNVYRMILEPELLPHYNEVNETIRVVPAGKHVTKENLEERPVETVLEHGYYVNEKGLVVLKSVFFPPADA